MKVNRLLHFTHKNKKEVLPKKAFFDQLPNDVIIYALRKFDISSIHTISHVSRRLRYLVGIVLSYYTLPQLRLSTLINQEGRGVMTTYYYFQYFDINTFTGVFQVATSTTKRYRMDGQTPRLKSLSMISDKSTLLYKLNKPLKRSGVVYYYSSSLVSSSYTRFSWSFSYFISKNTLQVSLRPNTIRIPLACFFGKEIKDGG